MKPRILIIDSPVNVEHFKKEIEPLTGNIWEFIYSDNPAEALDLIRKEEIVLVICGACVPGLDCINLSHQITKHFEGTQVLINSSNGSGKIVEGIECKRVSRQEFIQSKAFDYIPETSEPYGLIERIHIALEAKRMTDSGFF